MCRLLFLRQRRAKVRVYPRTWRLLTIPERVFCIFGDCIIKLFDLVLYCWKIKVIQMDNTKQ